MTTTTRKKLFLASSSELAEDRQAFEIFVNRKNKEWFDKGVFIHLEQWEDFLDAMSRTRLQDEYDKAIHDCDLFVMLFWRKVGLYTREEFETAFGQFQTTNRPFIFTYFKDVRDDSGSVDANDLASLQVFQARLHELGHFQTRYQTIDGLTHHFGQQLDKLVANGFIEFRPDEEGPVGMSYAATLTGNGAIAQGEGATAVGPGGVNVGGNNAGPINTGTQIDTGGAAYVRGNITAGRDFVGRDRITKGIQGADLDPLFASVRAAVGTHASPDQQAVAGKRVREIEAEVVKGEQVDDSRLGRLIDGLLEMVPGAVGAVVKLFATPILGGIVGPVTRVVLDKWKTD